MRIYLAAWVLNEAPATESQIRNRVVQYLECNDHYTPTSLARAVARDFNNEIDFSNHDEPLTGIAARYLRIVKEVIDEFIIDDPAGEETG